MADVKIKARFRKKFALACVMFIVASVALFLEKLGGSEWFATCTAVLGIFSAADVTEKRAGDASDYPVSD